MYVPCVLSRNDIKETLVLELRPTLDLKDTNLTLTTNKSDIFTTMFKSYCKSLSWKLGQEIF